MKIRNRYKIDVKRYIVCRAAMCLLSSSSWPLVVKILMLDSPSRSLIHSYTYTHTRQGRHNTWKNARYRWWFQGKFSAGRSRRRGRHYSGGLDFGSPYVHFPICFEYYNTYVRTCMHIYMIKPPRQFSSSDASIPVLTFPRIGLFNQKSCE